MYMHHRLLLSVLSQLLLAILACRATPVTFATTAPTADEKRAPDVVTIQPSPTASKLSLSPVELVDTMIGTGVGSCMPGPFLPHALV
jgi:hypothetical protein